MKTEKTQHQFFGAEKQPIFLKGGKQIENKMVVVRTDTTEAIGIVGSHYEVVDDNKLYNYVSSTLKALEIKHEITKRYEIKGGARTITEITLPDIKLSMGKTNDFLMKLYMTNSFDGTTIARLTAGCYRLICSNGMVIGKKDFSIGKRHLQGINIEIVDIYSKYIKSKVDETKHFVIDLQNIKFKNDNEMVQQIEKENFLGKRYTEKIIEALDHPTTPQEFTGWKMYNAYTYVITHEINANQDNKLNRMKKLNQLTSSWK